MQRRWSASRRSAARPPSRAEIARFIVDRTQDQLRYGSAEFDGPLHEYLSNGTEPARLDEFPMLGRPRLRPTVAFRERSYAGREISELSARLLAEHRLTRAAAAALDWVASHAAGAGGIDLSGHRFVVMGAGAELAPTPLLLAAGASVLWIDVREPTSLLSRRDELAGKLVVASEARDLLREPRRIAAHDRGGFAAGDPVHLGLFAYAPGQSREWRLTAAMTAIVRSLDPALVRSVSLFISPTTPVRVQPEGRRSGERLRARSPRLAVGARAREAARDRRSVRARGNASQSHDRAATGLELPGRAVRLEDSGRRGLLHLRHSVQQTGTAPGDGLGQRGRHHGDAVYGAAHLSGGIPGGRPGSASKSSSPTPLARSRACSCCTTC